MRTAQSPRKVNLTRVGLVLLTIIISITAGISILVFQTSLSPLIVLVGVLATTLIYVLLVKPVWALYIAVTAVFIPQQVVQLLPIPLLANYLISILVLLAGISWLMNVAIQRRKIVWKGTILLMSGFMIWSVITLFWASNLTSGRQALITLLIGFLSLVLLVNQVNTAKALSGLLTTLALIGWMLVLAGIGTVLVERYTQGSRLNILGINENLFGIQLLLAMPGVLWQAIRPSSRNGILKGLMAFVYLVLAMGLIAMSGSRGSAISFLVILLGICLWKPTRVWGVLVLLVLVLGVLLTPLLFSTTLDRFALVQGDTLLGGREALWQATLNLIFDNFWLGVGIGNARHALVPYAILLRDIGGNDSVATHNPVLQVWAETGVPGILLYLSVLGSAIWTFIRQYLRHRQSGARDLLLYYALVGSLFFGYILSWIKGGGMESDPTYFLMLALLLIPAGLNVQDMRRQEGSTRELEVEPHIL